MALTQIVSWQDLAERVFHRGLNKGEIAELGLSFKLGKNFSSLRGSLSGGRHEGPFTYWAAVAWIEGVLKEHLDGNLSNDHSL